MSKCVRCRRDVEDPECPVWGCISTDEFDDALAPNQGVDTR